MKEFKLESDRLSRRNFLKLTATGTVAAIGSRSEILGRYSGPETAIPIALQLYSVRNDCAKDFDRATAQVAEMGFQGVEFAGYYRYGDDPKALRRHLDGLGLKVAGTHIQTAALRGEELPKTIEFHKTIGCKYLIVPGDRAFTDPEKCQALADTFNTAAAALKPEGMYCGYHNHKGEFARHQGKTFWELFAGRTAEDVVLQLDIGWAQDAGVDPVKEIRKYPGRTRTAHFKPTVLEGDEGRTAILGRDSVDWRSVIQACRESGGTEWFIIEQEYYPDGKTPMECSRLSLQGLNGILKRMTSSP
jgi:sugar phosphate isomerase/epimerase